MARLLFTLFLCGSIAAPLLGQENRAPIYDVLLLGGRVYDGTGNPWFYADVGIRDQRIVAVGNLESAPADQIIDVTGKVVTPGFIDIHSHAGDPGGLTHTDRRYRAAPNLVAQGITTLVVNQDGRSPWPIREQRETMTTEGIGPNAIMLVGHGRVRSLVMGEDYERAATPAEVDAMQALVQQAMEEGAFGLSGGHEYSPMIWSTTEEIVALAEVVVPWAGVYVVHERSSGAEPMWWWPSQDPPGAPTMLDAVLETITVAEQTGIKAVQTHLKARGANFWGSSGAIIQLIERARERGVPIWGDAYTYNTTGSDGSTVLIPRWVLRLARQNEADAPPDYAETLRTLLAQPEQAEKIRRDVQHEMVRRGDAERILIVDYPDASWIGKYLDEVARSEGVTPVEMALRLQLQGDPGVPGGARLRGFSLSEADVAAFHARPWVLTASDAGIALPEDGLVHPRFYGNFPRKIRRYALDEGRISVGDAIRTMTSLPAQVLGLSDRGMVREGYWADVVVMDLDQLKDEATPLNPHQYPTGITYVFVNGDPVVAEGALTGRLPGTVITPDKP